MRLVIDLQGAQGASRLRGIGRYSRALALAMARNPGPHEVLVALNGSLPTDELVVALGAVLPPSRIHIWEGVRGTAGIDPSSPPWYATAELVRAQFLANLRPDCIHIASLFEGMSDDVISTWPAALERLPMVATCYDLIPLLRRADYLDGPWRDTSAISWYFRRVHEMSLCDGLLAISESTRTEAIEHLGYRPERIFNIRAGVSPHFRPRPMGEAERAALLARYGLRPDFILYVGGGDMRKNETRLVQAFGLMPPEARAHHQLAIVGKLDPGTLAASVAAAGVPRGDVVLIPFVEEEDLPALYSVCAVSVLPSLHEGFGLPAAEAMACGAPTLASNTSSLPEVIGREDALFDPTQPKDIAAQLQAVLFDPDFRQSLIAHGLDQVANFTWEECARRAWDALEALHLRAGNPGRAGQLKPNPRLAFVSPLPPQESGIAEYSVELLPALARHYDVTLVCDHGTTSNEIIGHAFPVIDPRRFLREAMHFDRVLYQVGNSHFHLTQLETLLPAVPGVVTLHDAFLSGVLAWRARQTGPASLFTLDLLRSHGWPAVVLAAHNGPDAAQEQFPCSLPVLRAALGLVQHSEHGRAILAQHFGQALAARSVIIPHLRRGVALLPQRQARERLGVSAENFLVCSFGSMARAKLPDRLLDAWPSVQHVDPGAQLVFVGEPLVEVSEMLEAAGAPSAGAEPPRATGRVDRETYLLWLAAADVAVQLRTTSRGETSGAVADCLGAGLPTVVNAHGASAELSSDVVLKLPADVTIAALTEALLRLRADPAARRSLGTAARRYVMEELDPDRVAARYRDAIETGYSEGPAASRYAITRAAMAVLVPDEVGLAACRT